MPTAGTTMNVHVQEECLMRSFYSIELGQKSPNKSY